MIANKETIKRYLKIGSGENMLLDGKKILVVDDEAVVRESLEQYLYECDFEVKTAGNAPLALDYLNKGEEFDIAVVDIRMPEMNGEDFVVQAQKICPSLKFLIQTGTLDYRVNSTLVDLGVTNRNVLKKPVFELQTYIEKIEEILEAV